MSSGGQFSVVPPVPNFTDNMPAFFKALMILRMVTGLHPVETAIISLVSFILSPYSFTRIRQCIAIDNLVLICIMTTSVLLSYIIPRNFIGVNIDITPIGDYTEIKV